MICNDSHYTQVIGDLSYSLRQLAAPERAYKRMKDADAWWTRGLTLEQYVEQSRHEATETAEKAAAWLRADAARRLRECLEELGEALSYVTTRRMAQEGPKYICVYRRDTTSPTGVLHAGSFKLCEETEAVLRERGKQLHHGPQRGAYAGERPWA